MAIQAVFFDFDGTLIDSMPAHTKAWHDVLGEFGIEMDEFYFELHEGEKAEDTVEQVLEAHRKKMSKQEQMDLIERKRKLYRSLAPKGLIPEARELVNELRAQNIPCDIVTGSIRSNMEAVLSQEEFRLFRNIVTPAEYKIGKPNPDPFLTALKIAKIRADEAIVLENAPLGIHSAKAAGIKTVAITTTLPPDKLDEADYIISDYSVFLDFID